MVIQDSTKKLAGVLTFALSCFKRMFTICLVHLTNNMTIKVCICLKEDIVLLKNLKN